MTFDPSTAAPESTFDPSTAQEDRTPLRTALKAAVPEDPDNSAKAAAYSRKLHVPMDAVARNLQSIELQDTVMQYDQQLQTSPKLAKAMQDSQALARMAHDDIKPLAKIEAGFADKALAGAEMATLGVAQSIWNTPDAASRMVGYLASGPEQLGLPRMLNPIRGVQQVIDLVAKGQLPTGQKLGAGTNDIADMIGSAQKMLVADPSTFGNAYASVDQSGTRADAAMGQALKGNYQPLVDVVSDPGAWAAFIAQAAPSLAIAAKSGGSLQVIGWLEGMQTASSAQDFEKRTGQKVSDADFTQAFAQTALVNSFLEKAGLDKVLGAQGKGIAGVLKAILGEGGTEALQQVNSNAAVKGSFDPSQSLSEGVLASAMGGGGSGGGGAVLSNTANKIGESVAARDAEIRKGEVAAQFLQAQLQAASASALRERSPEDFRQLVQQMADQPGGAPSSVYVDSEVLATLPEDVLNQLPQAVRDELQDALASNDVVAIPVGDALAVAPGTPLEKMLTEYGRAEPSQMTATEANNAREQSQQWLSTESERIINEAADKTAWQQGVDAVKTNIAAQLNATGRFRESVTDAYATYTSAFYSVLAERTGSTPEQMAAKYPLNIVNQTGKGAVLNSDGTRVGAVSVEGYHYSPAQRNALYTDFFGTGLQGSGREQYQNSEDKRLSKRLSFYVDTGTGINPEAGVGAYGHKAQLDNIYDSNSDPLRLKKGGQLAFESAVLDAGFSGYLDRMDGTQSGQVILLGAQKGVVPEQLGSIGKTTGARVPPAATRESKGRDKIVDALTADKTLPQGAPTKARWQELLAKQPEVLKALTDAGVFEGDQKENLFKSELLKWFEAKTESPVYNQAPLHRVKDPSAVVTKLFKNLTPDEQKQDWAAETFAQMPAPEGRQPDGSLQGLPNGGSYFAKAGRVAEQYMADAGLPYAPPDTYQPVNVARAERIAAEFDKMEHNPQDPDTKRAYAALVKETTAQYEAVMASGLQVEFVPAGAEDPYGGNPRGVIDDVRTNNHMWVFSTREGFGTDANFDPEGNPLLAETAFEISGQKALANDLFRVVHDYFGHIKEGVGFRASGEENAWRAHSSMFSREARRAMTTETRGQNSWLNFGPYGETNRTAKVEDTHFADQKIGLLPEWVSTDGATDAPAPADIGADLAAAIKADPEAAMAEYAALPESDGGRVINTDIARELSPAYREDRTRSGEVHEAASAFTKAMYATKLSQPTPEGKLNKVLFTAGGTGAGKSTGLALVPAAKAAEIIYDTNMNTLSSAVTKIDQALEAGRTVDIIYVFRDPVEALTAGALPRAMRMGRTVPLQDHADTHVGARETATLLQERYKDDPRVVITAIDNSRGRGNAAVTALDKIPQIADNDLKGSLYEALKTEFREGRISEQVYAGTSGEKVGQQTGGPADGRQYQQTVGAKGTFNPKTLELALNANADLSTFLHESAHFFLEVMADVSRNPTAPADITADMVTLLGWFGVKDLAAWDKLSLDEKRTYHERFAESFEQYLMEGKSPVVEMRPLFRKFRAWMTNVYKSLKDFAALHPDKGIKLSDEVRQVFDRMLATREQIAEAEQSAGLLPDDAATEAAVDQLTARSLRDMKWMTNARNKAIKALQKEAAGVRKKIVEEVTAEANALPEFAAKDVLDKSKKENKQQLNNTELAIVADAYGYPSVEEMIRAIDAAGNKADYIEGRTDQRMLEENGDLVDPRAIGDAANEAIHNAVRAKVLATELKTQSEALAVRAPTGKQDVNGRPVTVNALVEASKLFAANVVGRVKIKELKAKAWQYTMAERRSAKTWQEATKKGDTMAAVKAKQDQMLNHAAAKGALDAQDEVRKIGEFFGKVTKGNNEKVVDKGRDPDIVNAARAVLGAYGIGTPSSKTAQDYLDLVKANDPDLWAILQPSVDGAERAAKPADQLTLEELQGLHEEIQAMWYLAENSRQMEVAGNKLNIADLADALIKKAEEKGLPTTERGQFHALTPREILATKLQFAKAILRRVEQWSESMDGKYGGPFLRYIFQPVKEAADRCRTDKTEARKAYKNLVAAVGPAMTKGLIEAPELNYTFGKGHNSIGHAELLHAILHTGNDSNKRKLLLGRKWATENPDGTLDTTRWDNFITRMQDKGILGKVHYDFAQGVWDLLDSTKPLAQQAHREVFGRYFNEVTANTFTTPFGDYRGGYVPAVADSRLTADADLRAMENAEKEAMTFAFPTTNKGFTKARVDYNRPLVLDLRTISQHLDKVLTFSHMEPAVRSANRLLREKGVSTMLNRMDPSLYSGMLLPWLNRSAKQIVETPVAGDGGVSRIASVIRARAGMALMFGNLPNALQQVSGLATAMIKVNPGDMMRATATYLAHPKQTAKLVSDSSAFMKQRIDNEIAAINGAIDDIVLDASLYENAQRWTARHGYFLQTAMDNVIGPIVWTGAYNQAVAEGMTHDDAVRFADGTIRQTQGSTLPEDVSRIETGPAYARLFSQFIGYFNMLGNTNGTALQQVADDAGLKRGAGKALYITTVGLLATLWIAEAIAVGMRGGPDDKDKDGYLDDWIAAVLGFGTIKGVLATVPFVGQLGNAAINRFNTNPADDRISLSPAVSLLEGTAGNAATLYKLLTGDADKVNKRNAIRDVASAVSIFTGLPASFAARPLGYLAGVATDKIEPTGPVDAARGMLTGTPSPESKQ